MKTSVVFVCGKCESKFPKWEGRCRNCGEWNSLVETNEIVLNRASRANQTRFSSLNDVKSEALNRFSTGVPEVDFILGGNSKSLGVVPGALILLGGDPGIGKSTLALQIALNLADRGVKSAYVSGEESLAQLRLRASRLKLPLDKLLAVSENNLENLLLGLENLKVNFLVIDSIQTLYSESSSGVAGGAAQVANATHRIMEFAKSQGVATLIIGHVTKEGNLAGPRMLEHMVDVVLYLEGERLLSYRILRCVKNRFGSTSEAGVFEMKEKGLVVVENPSALFLSDYKHARSGTAVSCVIEGSRPLLVEIQALAGKSQFNYPKRTSSGFDYNRLLLLSAVLQRHFTADISEQDIFISVAGGFKIDEPACDLAVALAVVSSYKNLPLPKDLAVIGEVGLSGDVRPVTLIDRRISEASKMGFKQIILPVGNKVSGSKLKIIPVSDLRQAISLAIKKT